MSIIPSVVYVASPIQTFSTDRYEHMVAAVRRRWPRAVILEPKHLYTGNGDWLRRWDAVLALLTELVYLTDPDGFHGPGVHKELEDAHARGLPVWYLTDDGIFHPDAEVQHERVSSFIPATSRRARLRRKAAARPSIAVGSTRRADTLPRPDPRRGPDSSLIVAAFRSSDGTRHEGVRFRQANAVTIRNYQTAVARARAGDDSGLAAFRSDDPMLASPDQLVYDTRARRYHLLTDGDRTRRYGEAVSIEAVSALSRRKRG